MHQSPRGRGSFLPEIGGQIKPRSCRERGLPAFALRHGKATQDTRISATYGENGGPNTIRTCGLYLRRVALYPAELWDREPVLISRKRAALQWGSGEKLVTEAQTVD